MSETTNLKLFMNDNPATNINPFNVEKSINEPYKKIDEFAGKAGTKLNLNINTTNYIMTLELLNANGTVVDTKTIDFPLESMVVNGKYENKKIILTLQNGTTVEIPVGALIDGLVSQEVFDESINDINVEITEIKQDITQLKEEQITQNEEIEAIKAEDQRIREDMNNTIPSVPGSGEVVSLKGTTNARFKKFEIGGNSYQEKDDTKPSLENPSEVKACGDNGNINFSIMNKNILKFNDISSSGIVYHDTNKITIKNPTSYLYARPNFSVIKNFAKGKRVTVTLKINGSISEKNVDFICATNKNQYKYEYNMIVAESPYKNKIYRATNKLADDEYLSSLHIYTGGATCDLELEVQIEIDEATDIIPHEEQNISIPTQKPFRAVGITRDTFTKNSNKWYENHLIAHIESYNSEIINTEYISSTGQLSEGATIDYVADEPELIECTEEQSRILDEIENTLHSYKGTTHILSTDEVSPIFDVKAFADIESYIESKLTATNVSSEPTMEQPSVSPKMEEAEIGGV